MNRLFCRAFAALAGTIVASGISLASLFFLIESQVFCILGILSGVFFGAVISFFLFQILCD